MSFPCIAGNSSAKECYEHHLSTMSEQLGTMQADSKGFHLDHSQSISTLMSFIAFFHLKLKKKIKIILSNKSKPQRNFLKFYSGIECGVFYFSPTHICAFESLEQLFFFFLYSEPYTNKLLDWSVPQPGN